MYLKRLESVGFKSFAERIQVEFVPGVTAVVGPNGSGKSNITDAIRWVLGEQSARTLRGAKMEDIIFQGSDTRKPLNVAEVTLVLDNSSESLPLDYKEVSVTRRVYRSGDSEFYINKQSCRLKDIVELFMDSGLGREAFSIISQGKVEEILSSKAEERRTIFEEAAGVLKYKQRKRKAEYKLAETEENLNRVDDIIHEIEQQIEPLEEQAAKAKRYVELKGRLKDQEISCLVTEIEALHEEWQSLLHLLEQEKQQEIALKTAMQHTESKLEKERSELDQLDKAIEVLQADLLEATQRLEQFEGKKRLLLERTKHYAENKEKLETQKIEWSEKISQMELQLQTEKEVLNGLQKEKKSTKNKVLQWKEQLEEGQDDIAAQIENMKSDYIEYLNEQAAKRNERQSINQQKQQMQVKQNNQSDQFHSLLKKRSSWEEKLAKTKGELEKAEQVATEQNAAYTQLKTDLEQDRKRAEESQHKLYQGLQHIEKLKSRKEMLEEMKADYQGYFHGVKAVLKARKKGQLTNIHGAIIDLIQVPKQYITAIETVLGGQAQHVVVEHEQAAREAITWLKQTNNGRATFLPLDVLQPRFIPADLIRQVDQHDGYVGVAAALVDVDNSYVKAIQHVMGHVVVAKTLKDANAIAALLNRRYRVVTLEGDVVNPGGAMTGGAQKKTNQSLFTREKDLQDITAKLATYEQRAATFEQNVNQLKREAIDKANEVKQLEINMAETQTVLQKLRAEKTTQQTELKVLQENLTLYDRDQQQFAEDDKAFELRDEQLQQDLAAIEARLAELQHQIDLRTKDLEAFKDNRQQLQQHLHQAEIALAEQEERERYQREKTAGQMKRLEEARQSYEEAAGELKELEELHEKQESGITMDEQIASHTDRREQLLIKIQEQRGDRQKRTQLLQDAERELKEEGREHQEKIKSIQQKEVKANRLDVDLENKLSHLQTEYMITFERAQQSYEKVEDLTAAQTAVKDLKTQIERLGTVNIGAIDEYDRISERYTFLSEQKQDLVEAKQTLFAVISEMDEEMEKLFEASFSQIQAEFSVVFKALFGGGRAELKLTDPKNMLETGVDIIAQPPGKKLQNLGLLSGGERALTAISLLFAILRVRPVPFCVLDEVEAALDEANVARFAKYVRMHSKETQFIVITHRKGTMEEADVLYGVTMQESGVSRLVSVRLEDTKELIES